MFDIGWPEFFVILVVALVIIGPKDLPRALHTVGKWVRAARKVTGEFQRHVDDMVRDTELEDIRKGVQQAKGFNVKRELEKTMDPDGALKDSFDVEGRSKSRATAATNTATGQAKADTTATRPPVTAADFKGLAAPGSTVKAGPPPVTGSAPAVGAETSAGASTPPTASAAASSASNSGGEDSGPRSQSTPDQQRVSLG